MITVTFIRHGESEDNLKQIWAGWRDAPLTELGQNQAQALAEALSCTRTTHIYASPLKRAHSTGLAVHSAQPDPKPHFSLSPLLREQTYGIAEGYPWVLIPPDDTPNAELYARNIFPVLYGRHEKYPDGESLEDVAIRGRHALRECVLPHLKEDGAHIALASHGRFITEMLDELVALDPDLERDIRVSGLVNTGWTRVQVAVKEGHIGDLDPAKPPPLNVHITHLNNSDHLRSLAPVIRKGEDQSNADSKGFFGGAEIK